MKLQDRNIVENLTPQEATSCLPTCTKAENGHHALTVCPF